MKKTNCTVHGKKMYRIRTKIGEDLDGKPVYRSFYGDGKVEAERKRDEYIRKEGVSTQTLGQLMQFYVYKVMPGENLSTGTIEAYERPFRLYIRDSRLSIRPMADITPADLHKFISEIDATQSAIVALVKVLHRFFRWAYQNGYSPDLMYGITVRRPARSKTGDISVFNDEEVLSVIRTPNRLHFLFFLALSSGLREGEILALRWSDFEDGAVTVRRQLKEYYAIDGDGYRERTISVGKPKSASSLRTVPLPDPVWRAYLEFVDEKTLEQAENGYRSPYLFTTQTGKFIDRKDFRTAWTRHLKRAGISYRKFHSCRATYCTLLCKNGVPLETAAKLMGHSDVSVTASFYRMVSDREMSQAADRLSTLFGKPSGDKVATLPGTTKKEQS